MSMMFSWPIERGRLRLLHEALHHLGVLGHLAAQHLERDRLVERGVHRLVDDAHAALADALARCGSGHRRRCRSARPCWEPESGSSSVGTPSSGQKRSCSYRLPQRGQNRIGVAKCKARHNLGQGRVERNPAAGRDTMLSMNLVASSPRHLAHLGLRPALCARPVPDARTGCDPRAVAAREHRARPARARSRAPARSWTRPHGSWRPQERGRRWRARQRQSAAEFCRRSRAWPRWPARSRSC